MSLNSFKNTLKPCTNLSSSSSMPISSVCVCERESKREMVGLPYDWLANPLGAVRLTFEKAVASGSDPATFDGRDWGITDLFRKFLFDNNGLSQKLSWFVVLLPIERKIVVSWETVAKGPFNTIAGQ